MLATILGTVGATISPFTLTVLEQRQPSVNVQQTTHLAHPTATVVTMTQQELSAQLQQ